jgi:hypothetical protein
LSRGDYIGLCDLNRRTRYLELGQIRALLGRLGEARRGNKKKKDKLHQGVLISGTTGQLYCLNTAKSNASAII